MFDRIQLQIIVGTLLILIITAVVIFYGLNERERMAEFERAQQGRAIEAGAALYDAQCSRCHGTQGTGIPGLCPPLNDRYFFDERLTDVGWNGTMEDYIVSTATSGRLSSTRPDQYPGQGVPAMPSFSQQVGGPLREDQIRNIAAFIMNWEETATAIEIPPTPSGPIAGTEITKDLPEGDAQNGEVLSQSFACTTCHIDAPTGPYWLASDTEPGIGERASTRISQPDYSGQADSPEQYLYEAVVNPGIYLVSGFADGVMPNNYGSTLTEQDLADIIAYLLTLK